MKMNWFSKTSVVAVSLTALVACSSTTTGTTGGAGGAGGDTTATTTGTAGGGGATGGAGGSGPTGADCTCACTTLMSAGGCADLCDDAQNGNPNTPNYCNGSAALSQCSACLSSKCSFSAADIADDTTCK